MKTYEDVGRRHYLLVFMRVQRRVVFDYPTKNRGCNLKCRVNNGEHFSSPGAFTFTFRLFIREMLFE